MTVLSCSNIGFNFLCTDCLWTVHAYTAEFNGSNCWWGLNTRIFSSVKAVAQQCPLPSFPSSNMLGTQRSQICGSQLISPSVGSSMAGELHFHLVHHQRKTHHRHWGYCAEHRESQTFSRHWKRLSIHMAQHLSLSSLNWGYDKILTLLLKLNNGIQKITCNNPNLLPRSLKLVFEDWSSERCYQNSSSMQGTGPQSSVPAFVNPAGAQSCVCSHSQLHFLPVCFTVSLFSWVTLGSAGSFPHCFCFEPGHWVWWQTSDVGLFSIKWKDLSKAFWPIANAQTLPWQELVLSVSEAWSLCQLHGSFHPPGKKQYNFPLGLARGSFSIASFGHGAVGRRTEEWCGCILSFRQ